MKYLKTLCVSGFLAVSILGQFQIRADDNAGTTPVPSDPTTNSVSTVSIVATDAEAAEAPINGVTNTAVFTISRTGPTTNDLNVFLNFAGTAAYGTEYTATPLLLPPAPSPTNTIPVPLLPQIVIPAGASNVQLTIWPINDDLTPTPTTVYASGTRSVVVHLEPPVEILPTASATNPLPPFPVAYFIDPNAAIATALILDNDAAPTNRPPFVEIVSPGPETTIVAPTTLPINAIAYDRDGTVQSVEFFVNGNSLGVVSGAGSGGPTASVIASFIYSVKWSVTDAGTYTLTAKATDNMGATSASDAVIVMVRPAPTNQPPVVAITSPSSNAVFTLPTSVAISATVSDSSANIRYVAFFANDHLINVQSGTTNSVYTFNWTDIDPGNYNLTAAALDFLDARGVSAPVPITVNRPPPAPAGQLFNVNFGGGNKAGFAATGLDTSDVWNAINGSAIIWSNLVTSSSNSSPITVEIHNADGKGANNSGDAMYDSYVFPTGSSLVPPPIYVSLHGVPFGKYDVYLYGHSDALPGLENDSVFQVSAAGQNFGPLGTVSSSGWQSSDPWQEGVQYVAMRDVTVGIEGNLQIRVFAGFDGLTTGDPRHAAVLNGLQLLSKDFAASNAAPTISLVAPTNGAVFPAFSDIVLTADAEDSDGVVSRVDFFEGTRWLGGRKLIGSVNGSSSSNLVSVTWSKVLSGNYVITARATDNGGKTAASVPVKITVSETNTLAVVNIMATDRYAVEPTSNSVNTATFTVYRSGDTTNPLLVFYSIAGSASNGVDYATLPGTVTIPAGTNSAAITITPIDDNDTNEFDTVILSLVPSPAASPLPTYAIGRHSRDVAFILDNLRLDPPVLPGAAETPKTFAAFLASDGVGHLAIGGEDGDFVVIEVSSDLTNWTYLTHGLIVGGQLVFVDPNATGDHGRFYRSKRP